MAESAKERTADSAARAESKWNAKSQFLRRTRSAALLMALTFTAIAISYGSFRESLNLLRKDSQKTVTDTCYNWSGYTVESRRIENRPKIDGVSGSWVVQKAVPLPMKGSTDFSQWAGIGGSSDTTLIQAGSESMYSHGKGSYTLWYELLPNFLVTVDTIRQGDTVFTSIAADSAKRAWEVRIEDISMHLVFRRSFRYNSSESSAEVVMEDLHPFRARKHGMADLPEVGFGPNYTGIPNTVTIGKKTENFSQLPTTRSLMQMLPDSGAMMAPSAMTSNGSFSIKYYNTGMIRR